MSDLIEPLDYPGGVYRTPEKPVSWFSRKYPSLAFYRQFGWDVWCSARTAQRGLYDGTEWTRTSHGVIEALESVGVQFEISGTEHIRALQSPCVFVGNHMSMLETMVLPAIIQPIRDVTFVVKQSLIDYPVFKHILRSRDPIGVTRESPRDDLKVVMQEGVGRLQRGVSVIVFPQTTRSSTFDADQFNSIGVKLAMRAGVPVVPIALKTDAWRNGKRIKDIGPIDPSKTVRFAFGEPMAITNRGAQQHQLVVDFIETKLSQWGDPVTS
ncbi:2-acyl-glycerophospho-ethanolamine acyltransferase [Rubripirellula amarantea]|uniref:2-acyl-glycerophospho-ethanolamine acyltransferase n=1 Tax=Rubripirellula amarantea TaxID=2527999 RepID=A0A5C5WWN0_9BACT|nr:lysophospholipid acyltransferase family protein [Rubripirellula amarantea]TWT55116.1 2-acyl-glycerophospho-ethanolamine acyltransferase [Rubripirellula amarantea]